MKTAIVKIYLTSLLAVSFLLITIYPEIIQAGESKDGLPHHHISLLAGLAVETKRATEDENGLAYGFEYELRFHEHWGVGVALDDIRGDSIRNLSVVFPVNLHPKGNWRVLAGPGVEFTDKKDKFMFRLGVGYEFPLGGHWTLAPEVFTDLIEGGAIIFLGGLAIGYGF